MQNLNGLVIKCGTSTVLSIFNLFPDSFSWSKVTNYAPGIIYKVMPGNFSMPQRLYDRLAHVDVAPAQQAKARRRGMSITNTIRDTFRISYSLNLRYEKSNILWKTFYQCLFLMV